MSLNAAITPTTASLRMTGAVTMIFRCCEVEGHAAPSVQPEGSATTPPPDPTSANGVPSGSAKAMRL